MINFRLREAGLPPDKSLFTPESIKFIFEESQGYPRRIAMMCHNALEELIMDGKETVDNDIITKIIGRENI